MAKVEKFELDIPEETYRELERNAEALDTTPERALQRALDLETYVLGKKSEQKRILVENGNGTYRELVFA